MNAATNRLLGRVHLLQHAVLEHGDAVAQRHRLDLVVRDVDRGGAEPFVQSGEFGAHLHPQLRVQVRQGLVHEERARLAHHGAADGDALALAAR